MVFFCSVRTMYVVHVYIASFPGYFGFIRVLVTNVFSQVLSKVLIGTIFFYPLFASDTV